MFLYDQEETRDFVVRQEVKEPVKNIIDDRLTALLRWSHWTNRSDRFLFRLQEEVSLSSSRYVVFYARVFIGDATRRKCGIAAFSRRIARYNVIFDAPILLFLFLSSYLVLLCRVCVSLPLDARDQANSNRFEIVVPRPEYVTRFFLSGERFSGATVDFLLYIEAMGFRNFVNDPIASDRLANRWQLFYLESRDYWTAWQCVWRFMVVGRRRWTLTNRMNYGNACYLQCRLTSISSGYIKLRLVCLKSLYGRCMVHLWIYI